MEAIALDTSTVRDLAPEALGAHGRLKILPASYWATTTMLERALFGHRHGLYGLPTVELVARLADIIAGRPAIEIGAGSGVLAEALGIPATDNRMQEKDPYRLLYAATGQPAVRYGPGVIELDARRAVRRYRPDVVIASWVTHRWDPGRPHAEGNEIGVDEEDVLAHCRAYVVIGNERTHRHKAIWRLPHQIEYPSFLYSRAHHGGRDFLAVWAGATLMPTETAPR